MSGLVEKNSTFWVLEDGTQVPLFEDIPWCPTVDLVGARRSGYRHSLYVNFYQGLCWSLHDGLLGGKGYVCEKKLH